jgi:D-tyrosyl-tRNA(Tyr) deacylase
LKAVIQRVSSARIKISDKVIAEIEKGLMILLGVRHGDTIEQARVLADKCSHLRIFEDKEGKFNLSLVDTKGEALVASQFTLLADTSRGRRPSFTDAEEPEKAKILYEYFIESLKKSGINTRNGIFGERMHITINNDGPVTIIMEV